MKDERKKTKKQTKKPTIINRNKNKSQDKTKSQDTSKKIKKVLKPPEFPEAIVNIILDKIISFAVRQSTVKEIYTHMDKKCFTFIKSLINPYLSTEFINYENGLDNVDLQRNKINYKINVTEKVNTWDYFPEPNTPGIDRYSSAATRLISLKNEQIENDEKYRELKEALKNRISHNRNSDIIVNESSEFDSHDKKNSKKSRKSLLKMKKYKEQKSIEQEEKEKKEKEKEGEKEKKRKERERKEMEEKISNEFPFEDLPKEKYENKYFLINENEENNELRKERKHLIKKKLELKMLQEIQDKKDKLKSFHNRLQKMFDGSKQTFDSEGKIMLIHSPHVNNFISEFNFAKIPNIQNKQKKIEKKSNITTQTSKTIKTKASARASKNISKENNTNLNESKNEWEKQSLPQEIKQIFEYIKNVLLPKWLNKNSNITKTLNEQKNLERKKSISSNKPFRAFFGPFLQKYVFKGRVVRNPYDIIRNNQIYTKNYNTKGTILNPSGSNFNLIKPETGVVIESKNNKKKEVKDGGFEYIKKYNKPSMYEFSKLVMETSNLNSLNSRALSSGLIESKINEINEIKKVNRYNEINKDDYNGYILEFSDNANPLFQGALSLNEQKNGEGVKEGEGVGDMEEKNEKDEKKEENVNYEDKNINIFRAMEEGYLKSKYNSVNTMDLQNSIKLSSDINNLYSYFEDRENINRMKENILQKENNLKIYSAIKNKKKNNNIIIYQAPLPVIKSHRVNSNKSEIKERKNIIKGRRILNNFNYSIINDKNWGEEDLNKKKELSKIEYHNTLKNKNSEHNLLKKVGENIINTNKSHRIKRSLIKSASVGNIF